MELKDHVLQEFRIDGERIVNVSPFSVLRVYPDGSAMLYKNSAGTIETIALSPTDIAAIGRLWGPFSDYRLNLTQLEFANHVLKATETALVEASKMIPGATTEFLQLYHEALRRGFVSFQSVMPLIIENFRIKGS